jgi:Domain of unknown function (DUF1840)
VVVEDVKAQQSKGLSIIKISANCHKSARHRCIVQLCIITFGNIQTPINSLFCDEANFMLFKFKSKIEGDLIMLEFNARHMLQIIGKEAGPPGIIVADEMPKAVAALERAIAHEEAAMAAAKKAASEHPSGGENTATPADPVPLRQRSLPFMKLLKACSSAHTDIVWGV